MKISKFLLLFFSSLFFTSNAFSFFFNNPHLESILCQNPNQLIHSFSGPFRSSLKDKLFVTTWNIHKFSDDKSFTDLDKISVESDIVFIQEGLHSEQIQDRITNNSDKNFQFYKSFCTSDQATGVMTASKILQEKTQILVSSDTEPIASTPKVTGYSQVQYKGKTIHLFNTHALNFNVGIDFEKQISDVALFMKSLTGPIIWAGDFNTWNKGRTDFLMKITSEMGLKHLSPQNENRNLKLDHIFIRGFESEKTTLRNENSSDHLALETVLSLN